MVNTGTVNKSEEYVGAFVEKIPRLRAAGRIPMSVAGGLQWRLDVADRPVQDIIRANRIERSFYTGDSVYQHSNGDVKLVLDDQSLWDITEDTQLVYGAVPKTDEQWEQLTGDTVLSVPAKRVEEIHQRGYTQESVKDSLEWNFLARSHDRLVAYADTFFPEMQARFGYGEAMSLLFPSVLETPVQRAMLLLRFCSGSGIDGDSYLGYPRCRLVGVAPE